MARVNLTERDIDHIARVVATEVPRSISRDPMEYKAMIGAVVDTITNRVATGKYGATVQDVLNQDRAFSKIAGPARLDPYGKVENAPKASKAVKSIVESVLVDRARGIAPEIGGSVNYANPNYSDRKNLGWINSMIDAGAKKFGIGSAVHFHGVAPGATPAGNYTLGLPSRFGVKADQVTVGLSKVAELDRQFNPRYASPAAVTAGYAQYANSRRSPANALVAMAAPTTRQVERAVPTRAFDPGGLLAGKAAVSLSPVGTANASARISAPARQADRVRAMPSGPVAKTAQSVSLAPDRSMPSGPVSKTSKGLSYSLASAPSGVISSGQKMSTPAAPMSRTAAPMSVGKYSAPAKSVSLAPDRAMPSGPVSMTAKTAPSTAQMAAAYGQYAQSRQPAPTAMARAVTPSVAPRTQPTFSPVQRGINPAPISVTPAVSAPRAAIQGPLTTKATISPTATAGVGVSPAASAAAQAQVGKETLGGRMKGAIKDMISPENIAAASLSAAGSAVAGPVGGLIGGLLGRALGKQGISNINNQPMSINNIGGGLAAVSSAMGGPRGTQANYYSPGGGGTITSLGNGSYSRTSSKYGYTEVTDASGRISASKGGGLLGGLFGGNKSSSSKSSKKA